MTPSPSPHQPIGVFDSGVGGLTVLHELLVDLPQEDYLYLGDTARFPYGVRSADELAMLAIENAELLIDRGAKLLVIACNSATAAGLSAVQEHLERHHAGMGVIGVIAPEASQAVETTTNGRVGVLATPATVASGAYEDAIKQIEPAIEVTSVACADLAPMIQTGDAISAAVLEAVRGACAPLIERDVDTVVLGCTHYPLLAPMFQRVLGRGVQLVTSGEAVVRRIQHQLSLRGLATASAGEGRYRFLATGDPRAFAELGTRFLQLPIEHVEQVELGTGSIAAVRFD